MEAKTTLNKLRAGYILTYDQMVAVVDECCGPGVGRCLFCPKEGDCQQAWDSRINQMFDLTRQWRAKRKGSKEIDD